MLLIMMMAAAVATQQPDKSAITVRVAPPEGEIPKLAEPGPAALRVAALLLPDDLPSATAKWDEVIRDQLLRTTLAWRGLPCDQNDGRCVEAARKVASRNAPLAVQAQRSAKQWYYGIILQQKLSAEELAAAERFLASKSGAGLRSGLAYLLDAESDPTLSYAIQMAAAEQMSKRWKLTTAIEEFYDATAGLPRSTQTVPAPPAPYTPPQQSPRK
jgi:hypothetical protein